MYSLIIAFVGLLFLQVKYIQITMETRNEQFDESVKRSLYQVSRNLEFDQTLQFIEDDIVESEEKYSQYNQPQQGNSSSPTTVTRRPLATLIHQEREVLVVIICIVCKDIEYHATKDFLAVKF